MGSKDAKAAMTPRRSKRLRQADEEGGGTEPAQSSPSGEEARRASNRTPANSPVNLPSSKKKSKKSETLGKTPVRVVVPNMPSDKPDEKKSDSPAKLERALAAPGKDAPADPVAAVEGTTSQSVEQDSEMQVSAPSDSAELKSSTEDSSLDSETVLQAASALLTYRAKAKENGNGKRNPLEDEEDMVSIVISLKRAPRRAALKPKTIPLVHPLYTAGVDDVCFFVKDPQRLMKDHLAERGVDAVTKVLGVTKLEKRYATHEAKRELVQLYDLFLVDDRVMRMMPRLLGNSFVRAKKMPLVIRMDRDIPNAISKAMSSTSFSPGTGTTCAIRVGRANFSAEQIADNVQKAMAAIVEMFPSKLSSFQGVYLKSVSSPALPIFASLPTSTDFERTPEETAAQTAAERQRQKKRKIQSAKREAAEKAAHKREARAFEIEQKKAAAKAAKAAGKVSVARRKQNKSVVNSKGTPIDGNDSDDTDHSDGMDEAVLNSIAAGEADFSDSEDPLDVEDVEGETGDPEGTLKFSSVTPRGGSKAKRSSKVNSIVSRKSSDTTASKGNFKQSGEGKKRMPSTRPLMRQPGTKARPPLKKSRKSNSSPSSELKKQRRSTSVKA